MPMTDRTNIPCAKERCSRSLTEGGFRVTMDERNEKIGYKIREAQVHKVPYMIVIGDKDEEKGCYLGSYPQNRRDHRYGDRRVYREARV